MKKHTLILVDDHPLVISGIKAMLADSTEFEIIGDANDGEQALALVQTMVPDLLVLDIRMPKLTGIEVVQKLKDQGSSIKTLLLSMHDSEGYVLNSIRAGADGYLLKGATKEEIIKAFRIIVKGGKFFTGEVSSSIISNFIDQKPLQSKNDFNLTKRELQILNLVLQGMSNQEIADELEISKRTAEVHRFNLMKKMDVKNPVELANKAREYQLT
ncbi:response regulator transcription factor [Galbibacter sp.]|uniref:response regulator transcription factor n=1 Tax=Galbibacter sp. TaxID=2918471 RepID=UPI002BAF3033|nr:response regulator transcription factor [Galbibacter sp.]HLV61946.1 response regulator transcription factor [Galbibacter sp.]